MIRFEGSPDPNEVIYAIGLLSGANEVLLAILFALVLWRYRNLIPLIFGFVIAESLTRLVVQTLHPVGPEYFLHTPTARLVLYPPSYSAS
jgi:Gpi18-like mannosyltransferase